ncbi:MAG TPA: YbaK/EbsC family protein [Anaerolineales bacterium]|jgi:prolyl-tRNA editing enzyme YbaK/EbsC (Cys-tRNA(Pro) deacylase)
MALELVKQYFSKFGLEDKVQVFQVSSATVELAAQALLVEPQRIAKTLCFEAGSGCMLVVTAGDAKIDNTKFKAQFRMKASMLPPDEVLRLTGHAIGGVCPFALPVSIPVYLDISMKRFETVFPACGSANSAIELTCDELYFHANGQGWVDVCKGWNSTL